MALMAAQPDHDLLVVFADPDRAFVEGFLLPSLGLPRARVLLSDELTPGAPVIQELERSVERSRITVAVLSPAYLTDRWALFGEQLAAHQSGFDGRLVPLLLSDCALPLHIEALVALDFRDSARWSAEAARLRARLQQPAPVEELLPCPYPGMSPFGERDAARFYGRDAEIDELIGRLRAGERELYVIGPSGSGKSSLIAAGLLPRMAQSPALVGQVHLVRTARPGERPSARLAEALGGDAALPGTVSTLLAAHAPAERLLLFVDQLEELFTLADVAERRRFFAAQRALRGDPRCVLLYALRADFYGALLDSEAWPDLEGRFLQLPVAPLRGRGLTAAIEEPARSVGVFFEARLAERLLADAAGEPGALPLLQEALVLLWHKCSQRLLRLADYEALGSDGRSGLAEALARRADAVLRGLTARQRALAERIFLRLVSFGEGRPDTRRQQSRSALADAGDDGDEVGAVLARLIAERLLTASGDGRDARVELSHEVLITAWPTLREWARGRRADEERRRQLDGKVREWVGRGRGPASLLDETELTEAEQWMHSPAARELGYGLDLPALIEASRAAVDEERWQGQEARRLRALGDQEQGRQLLLEGDAVNALPYLVAAHREGTDGAVIRMLLAQAARGLPATNGLRRETYHGAVFDADRGRVVLVQRIAARIWDTRTGQPLTPPLEHRQTVCDVAFSPDGTRVVTSSYDGSAQLWDAETGRPTVLPLRHQQAVASARFSPDGSCVVTASADRTARIWDAASGRPLTPPLAHDDGVYRAGFSPDGTRVVTASSDGNARIWDARTGLPSAPPLRHANRVLAASFSGDGGRVVTASEDRSARVWDAATGEPIGAPLAHAEPVTRAVFSPDGTRVLTASKDKSARVWDAATGEPVTPPLALLREPSSARFSGDGGRVLTGAGAFARVWDAHTGAALTPPCEHPGGEMGVAAAFSADGSRVLTSGGSVIAQSWNAATGEPLSPPWWTPVYGGDRATLVPAAPRPAPAAGGHVGKPMWVAGRGAWSTFWVAFSSDGLRVISAGSGGVRVWEAYDGRPLLHLGDGGGGRMAAIFSPDGARIVTSGINGTARLWDAATGLQIAPPLQHERTVIGVGFSPDGARLVTASWDGSAGLWDAATGARLASLAHRAEVNSAVFSPDGTRVVTASLDHRACVWDAGSGRLLVELEHRGGVNTASFSPDGTRVVTSSRDYTARLWDAKTGRPLGPPLEHRDVVTNAGFSPDGARVVTAAGFSFGSSGGGFGILSSLDHAARVWDAATGQPLTPPLAHGEGVSSAGFDREGARVATASADGTARVWDAATGRPLAPAFGHASAVTMAAFSPDGQRLATVCMGGSTQLWDTSLDERPLAAWSELAREYKR